MHVFIVYAHPSEGSRDIKIKNFYPYEVVNCVARILRIYGLDWYRT